MSRFNQIKDPSDNPDLEAAYKIALEMGMAGSEEGVPINFLTALSERSDLLMAYLNFTQGIVMAGELPPTVKQMIAMTCAMQNNCGYCSLFHTKALESMGVPTEVVESCASDPELSEVPPPQRAILKFALKTARNPQSVTDDDFEALREFGFSDGEIMETVMMAGWSNFTNSMADMTKVAIDGE